MVTEQTQTVPHPVELTETQLARLERGQPVSLPLTEAEFLAYWPTTRFRAEYHNDHLVLMGLAAFIHEVLVGKIIGLLLSIYKPENGFFVAGSNVGLKVPLRKGYYNPDVMVMQGTPAFVGQSRSILTNPHLLVEVLSESTSNYDLHEKLPRYQLLPSLRAVLFVDVFEQAVYVAEPTTSPKVWTLTTYNEPDERVRFETNELPLGEFFANLPEGA